MSEESEREILERIEATRERMGHTIEEIGDRVNPDRVQQEIRARARGEVDELKDTVKRKARNTMDDVQHEVRRTGRGIWDTIRDNPLPAGMVGVGLAWLVANRESGEPDFPRDKAHRYDRDRIHENRYRPVPSTAYGSARRDRTTVEDAYAAGFAAAGTGENRYSASTGEYAEGEEAGALDRARDRAGETAHDVRQRGEEAMQSARETGQDVMSSAREGVHDAREKARDWAEEAGHRARRAEHRVEYAVKDNPLAAGAMAMALGFAAGLIVPETDRERELMGPTRDRALDRAQETARQAADKAHDAVRETAGESAKRAVDEVWSAPSGGEGDRAMNEPGR